MTLFDKLARRKEEDGSQNAPAERDAPLSSIEKAIAERGNQCVKVPLTDVAALGAAFAELLPTFRTVTTKGPSYIPVNMNPGDFLKKAKNGLNYGAHVTPEGKSVMTKWLKVDSMPSVMPVDPAAIMMLAMLAGIEKKLDDVKAAQTRILSFLEQDKQAEQQANLNMLTEIMESYKFNWDNPQWLQNHHMKILDIKQAAEKNSLFYQEQIASEIKAVPSVAVETKIRDSIRKTDLLFRDYRLALHLYAYSSFLEVMLLGNFEKDYLDQIADKVASYAEQYRKQHDRCRELVGKLSASSVETQVIKGLGSAGKALGKLIASSPVLSKGQVDEWLQESGDKLLNTGDSRTTKTAALFSEDPDAGVELFVNHIRNVKAIANDTAGIYIDNDAVYLSVA